MIKVTLQINEACVTIEGPEDFVRAEVRHLTSQLAGSETPVPNAKPSPGDVSATTEAKLVEEKQPANHSEIVAVLAYFMKQSGVEEFTEDDMRRAYLRAKKRPPKVVGQAIRDAKNTADFIEAGSGRGHYKLSHHGERTVMFDLPRRA